jgi:hypothetical protein
MKHRVQGAADASEPAGMCFWAVQCATDGFLHVESFHVHWTCLGDRAVLAGTH